VSVEQTAPAVQVDPVEQIELNKQVSIQEPSLEPPWWDGSGIEIVRATRSWIQYGTVMFAVICIVIGAVEALLGR
jgi:hypothetical protein